MKSRIHPRALLPFAAAGLALAALALLAGAAPAQEMMPDRIASPASIGEVDFPHRAHVEDYGFDCVECHHETRAAALVTPHPQYLRDESVDCGTCHDQSAPLEARSCSACHGARIATVAEDSLSAKVAIHQTCWRCHEPATGAAASASCTLCHHSDAPAAAHAAVEGR